MIKNLNKVAIEKELKKIETACRSYTNGGIVASYIPELANANPKHFGIACNVAEDANGDTYICCAGDTTVQFTMQSVSKTLILAFALEKFGNQEVFDTVNDAVCSEPFNSIVKLETKPDRRPMNPFINAGAIALSSLITGKLGYEQGMKMFSSFISGITNEKFEIDEKVFHSEKSTASRNRALAYFMESTDILRSDVDTALDFYFNACSINTTAEQLATIAAVIATGGKNLVSRDTCKTLFGIMSTCGMYDASGHFAVQTGLAAKSGVSGGIMAMVPGVMGLATFSPPLDTNGNSVLGIKAITQLSNNLGLRGF